jgi:hypothetical protein
LWLIGGFVWRNSFPSKRKKTYILIARAAAVKHPTKMSKTVKAKAPYPAFLGSALDAIGSLFILISVI